MGKNVQNNIRSDIRQFAVCVMVGGQSKRMGRPKENVIIEGDGRTFLDKICDEIDTACCEMVIDDVSEDVVDSTSEMARGPIIKKYISVRAGQKIKRGGYIPVEDIFDNIGPIGGIASVLRKAQEDGVDAVLFLACDMIRYESAEIQRVFEVYKGEDVLFARTENRGLQPLASIYSVKVLEAVEKQIEEGNYRLRKIAGSSTNIGYYDTVNEEFYANVNSLT
ncbi:MAG: molybdenum cofactor guanylyltransferase [Eubacterium sp.]|nr:molybdenum cofactor guanylyltransferase [Eubacterium sp.]